VRVHGTCDRAMRTVSQATRGRLRQQTTLSE